MKVNIIGGGIIGLFSAWYLQREGYEVHVFDKCDLSDGCSYGNAGMITPSHFIPLAAPGMVARGIRWLFDAKSPFYIKPRLDLDLVEWLWRFYRACNHRQSQAAMPVLLDFNLRGKRLYRKFYRATGTDFRLEERGILMLYKTVKKEKEEREIAEAAARLGMETRFYDRQEIGDFEDGIEVDALGGVYYPSDAHLHPNMLMNHLKRLLTQNGVQLHGGRMVTGFERKGKEVKALLCGKDRYPGDVFVVAGGSWSALLLRRLGIRLLLKDGKGYSFTLNRPATRPKYATILSEAKVAVTPMGEDLRFGGTLELGGHDSRINRLRMQGIVESIPQYYPGLKPEIPSEEKSWVGFRPCSPDGLPYIGRMKGFDNLVLATGHAMMGISLGPATGEMVRDVLAGKKIDPGYLRFFDPNR